MAFFRSVAALSRLRSSVGQQSNLANSVRWLQTPTSSNTDLYSEMKELVPEYQKTKGFITMKALILVVGFGTMYCQAGFFLSKFYAWEQDPEKYDS